MSTEEDEEKLKEMRKYIGDIPFPSQSTMNNNNYYHKIWNEPNNHGSLFWENVDFSKSEYKYQEMVFRDYLKTLDKSKIKSVLELGAGTGRMTKIVIDEFGMDDQGSIMRYDCVEPFVDINKVKKNLGSKIGRTSWLNLDITSEDFDVFMRGKQYDLILASEIFMHIKPQDIERVIQFLCRMIQGSGGQIINIDWAYAPYESDWCFIHPYHELYTKHGARMQSIISMENIKQALFHYRFD